MRKKLILIPLFMVANLVSAQCNIIGKPVLEMNETAPYSVDIEAQCTDCYQWKSTGNNVVFMDSAKGKSINIKGSGNGQSTLSVIVLTPNGIVQCNSNIEVNNTSISYQSQNNNSNCDIDISEIKEAKISDNLMGFFPSATQSSYNYSWEIEYFNGQKKTSTEKVPQFPYDKKTMPLKNVKLKVMSKKCLKELTKTYDESFWNFFN